MYVSDLADRQFHRLSLIRVPEYIQSSCGGGDTRLTELCQQFMMSDLNYHPRTSSGPAPALLGYCCRWLINFRHVLGLYYERLIQYVASHSVTQSFTQSISQSASQLSLNRTSCPPSVARSPSLLATVLLKYMVSNWVVPSEF